jgi:hypothetical protein
VDERPVAAYVADAPDQLKKGDSWVSDGLALALFASRETEREATP